MLQQFRLTMIAYWANQLKSEFLTQNHLLKRINKGKYGRVVDRDRNYMTLGCKIPPQHVITIITPPRVQLFISLTCVVVSHAVPAFNFRLSAASPLIERPHHFHTSIFCAPDFVQGQHIFSACQLILTELSYSLHTSIFWEIALQCWTIVFRSRKTGRDWRGQRSKWASLSTFWLSSGTDARSVQNHPLEIHSGPFLGPTRERFKIS